jgi:hypothetical protein
MRKRLESDKYYRWYATAIVNDLIDNRRFQTIVDYILLAWKAFPNLKKREMLNVKTIMYLNKKGKNEKTNIIRFNTTKLN